MWATIEVLGPTLKKSRSHATEQDRPDVAAARQIWREGQGRLIIDRLVLPMKVVVFQCPCGTATDRRLPRAQRP